MNSKSGKAILALGAACLLGGLPAHAALVSYAPGDLLMGIRATAGLGVGTTYVVNLGQVSTYRDAVGVDPFNPMTVNTGNIGADLTTIFGAGWASRTDLNWGIAGTSSNTATVGGDPVATLYLSRTQSSPNTPGLAPLVESETIRIGISTRIMGAGDTFDSYQQSPNSLVAAMQGSGDPNSWRSYMATGGVAANTPGGTDFGSGLNIEANPSRTLSLFRFDDGEPASYEGFFSISSGGAVTFVPEPASALLGGIGTLLLALRRRRNA
jgi:hypothetical protein